MRSFVLSVVLLLALVASALAGPAPAGKAAPAKSRGPGRGTWFYPGLGNCGKTDKRNATIVALATSTYAKGVHCDQYIKIKYNNKTAYGKVRDSCQSCGPDDVDMGPDLFKKLAPTSKGVIRVTWEFMPKGWKP